VRGGCDECDAGYQADQVRDLVGHWASGVGDTIQITRAVLDGQARSLKSGNCLSI